MKFIVRTVPVPVEAGSRQFLIQEIFGDQIESCKLILVEHRYQFIPGFLLFEGLSKCIHPPLEFSKIFRCIFGLVILKCPEIPENILKIIFLIKEGVVKFRHDTVSAREIQTLLADFRLLCDHI